MNHNITDLGIPAESELRGIGIISILHMPAKQDHFFNFAHLPTYNKPEKTSASARIKAAS